MPKEEPTARVSRIRGGLPGDQWRSYVSPGAERAYDTVHAGNRTKAKELRRKGRLIAAHRKEKAAYKIRVRGYDRKRRGEEPVRKGLTTKTLKLGPFERSTKEIKVRRPTKSEERRKTIQAIGSSIGGVRTLAALGAGAGVSEVVQDSREKSKRMAERTRNVVQHTGKEDVVASKSLDIYGIIGKSWDSPYDPDGLVAIDKAFSFAGAGKLFNQYRNAATKGYGKGGFSGAADNVSRLWSGSGGMKHVDKLTGINSGSMGTAGKVGVGAAAAGAGLYGAAKLAKPFVKRKALKVAGYGALGLGGTVAAGTAAGNMISGG